MDSFNIQLLTNYWIDNTPDDGRDLCSHGKVLLRINNLVLSDKESGDWTVASSALRLMKSATYGYDSKNEYELIPCCGYLRTFPSCPRYITWDTAINNNIIILSNVQYSETNSNGLRNINGDFKIEYIEYVTQILEFANRVNEFYLSSKTRKFYDKWDEEDYELFWKEFNEYHQILTQKVSNIRKV